MNKDQLRTYLGWYKTLGIRDFWGVKEMCRPKAAEANVLLMTGMISVRVSWRV